jgi:hypothetical protein
VLGALAVRSRRRLQVASFRAPSGSRLYIQHLHPVLAQINRDMGQLAPLPEQVIMLERRSQQPYDPSKDLPSEPQPLYLQASAIAAVRRRLAAARSHREQDRLTALLQPAEPGKRPAPATRSDKPQNKRKTYPQGDDGW